MAGSGEEEREIIRPAFDRSIMIDFQGAKITSDTSFFLLREIDERFGILGPIETELEDARSWVHLSLDRGFVRRRLLNNPSGNRRSLRRSVSPP